MDRNSALEEVRRKMRERKGGRQRDPNEYRPPQVKPDEILKLKFYVLPPLHAGDECAGSGKASKSMDLWYLMTGCHWINQKPLECPRIHDGQPCPFCQLGFDLLQDTDDEDTRKTIVKTYFPKQSWCVNIYFPPYESTPTELRGKVMWYAMQKTVYDIMEGTIMRDASKDQEDPQAYGLFYDPTDAYAFQLEVKRQGEYNEYKSSKFLPATKGPMIKAKNSNEADAAAIDLVLSQRHDLFTKFAAHDAEALAKRAQEVLHGEGDRKTAPAKTSAVAEDKLVDGLVDEPVEKTKPVPPTASKPAASTATKTAAAATPASPVKSATAKPVAQESDDELTKLLDDIRKGT